MNLSNIFSFIAEWWLDVALGLVLVYAKKNYDESKKQKSKYVKFESALVSLLRNGIIASHNKHIEKGYCPIYERENLDELFTSYDALGGNGVVPDLIKNVGCLPTHPPNKIKG